MKHTPIRNLACLLLLLAAIDCLVGVFGGKVIDTLVKTGKPGVAYNLCKVNSDIVIVGSSTASCHLVPSIVTDSLAAVFGEGVTCYNAGADYQGIPYCLTALRGVFSRYSPQMVIMDIQPDQLFGEMSENQQRLLRPYYACNRDIREMLRTHASTLEKLKLHSNLYRFNTEIIRLLASLRPTHNIQDGFLISNKQLQEMTPFLEIPVQHDKLPTFEDELIQIMDLCKNHHCDLFLIVSPFLNTKYSNDHDVDYLSTICRNRHIPLLNHLYDEQFQDYHLFRDRRHLNAQGAKCFTSTICAEIKASLCHGENEVK